jgi:hypothetical protein
VVVVVAVATTAAATRPVVMAGGTSSESDRVGRWPVVSGQRRPGGQVPSTSGGVTAQATGTTGEPWRPALASRMTFSVHCNPRRMTLP